MLKKQRCEWCGELPIYVKYHDEEWGIPIHNDNKLFEMLILEGAQAGLSWLTVLKKREHYKKVFDNFDVCKIEKYNQVKFTELLNDAGIIRNKLKITSAIKNAKAFIKIQNEFGSFDKYIWEFVNNKPIINIFTSLNEIPAKTEISDLMSKDLKKYGFNFVGSTICYAFMHAVGMVNDHTVNCFRYKELLEK